MKSKDNKEKNKIEIAKKNLLRDESSEVDGERIKGYDFNDRFDFSKFIKSYKSMGFQASNLFRAVEIFKKMHKEKAFVYLGYTSNLVSSGLRDVIRFLAEKKMIDVIVTTAGGIEEDFIKCLGDFKLGGFDSDGSELRERGINRIGNIFVPNSRYCAFEKFVLPVLEKYKNKTLRVSELIEVLAKEINNKESIYYWCQRNGIKVYCPAIMDGSLGDMIYFFKSKHPEFKLEISEDIVELNNSTIGHDKTGIIILGAGIIKHSICNANMYRNGADYAIYINSLPEFDGSDSGASPEEAVSWGKIKGKKQDRIKVFADATIAFPLIVAGFLDE
jgi:deoxyhypusine synthase